MGEEPIIHLEPEFEAEQYGIARSRFEQIVKQLEQEGVLSKQQLTQEMINRGKQVQQEGKISVFDEHSFYQLLQEPSPDLLKPIVCLDKSNDEGTVELIWEPNQQTVKKELLFLVDKGQSEVSLEESWSIYLSVTGDYGSSFFITYSSHENQRRKEGFFEVICHSPDERKSKIQPLGIANVINLCNLLMEGDELGIENTIQSTLPKCPTCGSTSIRPLKQWLPIVVPMISILDNAGANKQFQCNKCAYRW